MHLNQSYSEIQKNELVGVGTQLTSLVEEEGNYTDQDSKVFSRDIEADDVAPPRHVEPSPKFQQAKFTRNLSQPNLHGPLKQAALQAMNEHMIERNEIEFAGSSLSQPEFDHESPVIKGGRHK